MAKSPDAFRTISEVADWLGVQAHVLRFWESKFAQVKPIKRAGGRRYYRPADMLLLGGLKRVLHEDGLTIKGAQKLLREKGVSYVADLSQPLDDLTMAVIEGSSNPVETAPVEEPEAEPLSTEAVPDVADTVDVLEPGPADTEAKTETALPEPETIQPHTEEATDHATETLDLEDETPLHEAVPEEDPEFPTVEEKTAVELSEDATTPDEAELQPDLPLDESDNVTDTSEVPMVTFRSRHRDTPPPDKTSEPDTAEVEAHEATVEVAAEPAPSEGTQATQLEEIPLVGENSTEEAHPPKPERVDVTLVHDHTQIEVDPSALSALAKIKVLSPEHAQEIRPLLARLTRLRASMANPRNDLSKD